jgi:Family of unknown function (DUF6518)
MARLAPAIATALPAGILLGVAGQGIDRFDARLRWIAALGVPWLLVAFALGAFVHWAGGRGAADASPRDLFTAAALAGAIALVVATGAWYAVHIWWTGAVRYTVHVAAAWIPAAAVCGAVFALAGAGWASGGRFARPLGAAVAAGALIGEVLALDGEWPTRGAQAVLAAELCAGLLLPFVLARRAAVFAFALTIVVAVAMGVAEQEIRATLRAAGWRGL